MILRKSLIIRDMTGRKKKFPFKPKILRLELWSVSKWFLSKWPFLILMKSPFRSKNKTNYKADFSRWRNQSTNVDNASFFIEFHVRQKRRGSETIFVRSNTMHCHSRRHIHCVPMTNLGVKWCQIIVGLPMQSGMFIASMTHLPIWYLLYAVST